MPTLAIRYEVTDFFVLKVECRNEIVGVSKHVVFICDNM